jgi:hypothetical protein
MLWGHENIDDKNVLNDNTTKNAHGKEKPW